MNPSDPNHPQSSEGVASGKKADESVLYTPEPLIHPQTGDTPPPKGPDPVIVSANISTSALEKKKKLGTLLGSLFLLLVVLGILGLILMAYGYVPLGNKAWQKTAAGIVMTIPFMPKTPEYMLGVGSKRLSL